MILCRRPGFAGIVSVGAALLLASCSPSNPHPSPSGESSKAPYEPPPAYAHHSFVWDAPDGTDLLSPEMVAARAFFESVAIVANKDSGGEPYPGYAEAVARAQYPPEPDFQLRSTDVRGTDYLSVLSFEKNGDDAAVVVCWDHSGTAQRRKDGAYEQGRLPHAEKVILNHAGAGHSASATRQEGPLSAPVGDVFDGWRAVRYSWPIDAGNAATWGGDSAEYQKYHDDCFKEHWRGPKGLDWLSGPPLVNPDDPQFAPKPAYPGWPAAREG